MQARSPRPPSSVKALLEQHSLQQYADKLMTNGYDDLHFLAEVAEGELIEIGIVDSADRDKVGTHTLAGRGLSFGWTFSPSEVDQSLCP